MLYELPLLIAALTSFYLAAVVVRRCQAPGACALLVMLLAGGFWAAMYALELRMPTLDGKILATKLQYLGIACLTPAWFVFTLQFTGQNHWIAATRTGKLLLSLLPACVLLLALTNERHGLVWTAAALDSSTPINALVLTHGPAFWLLIGYSYILLLIGTLWMLWVAAHSSGLLRRQALALLAGMIPVWLANALYLLKWGPGAWLDLTPFAMAISGIIYAWSLLHLHLLDIVPIARAEVFEFIEDAIVVVDGDSRIADLNGAARRLASAAGGQWIGRPLSALLGDQAARVNPQQPPSAAHDSPADEITLQTSSGRRVFDLHTSPLPSEGGRALGSLCVLHDVTRRRRAEEALQQLALSLEQRVEERTSDLQAEIAERQKALAALVASEARNWTILETIPDLILYVRRTHAQPSALLVEPIGVSRHARLPLDRLPGQLLPPHIEGLLTRAAAQVGETPPAGRLERVEYELGNDGDTVSLEARIAPIDSDQFLVIVRDNTAQRRAEQQLHHQASLLENISDAVISVDRAWRIVSWNGAAQRLYGYEPAEVKGRPLAEVIPTTLADLTSDDLLALLESKGRWEGEAIQVRRDGSAVTVWASVSFVRDKLGQKLGAVAVNRDMSRILAMQQALQESEARYRDIVESTGDMIFSTDVAGRFLFVNRAWREALGYSEAEALELKLDDIAHPDAREHIQELSARLAAGEGPLPVDLVLSARDGRTLFTEGHAAAVFAAEAGGGAAGSLAGELIAVHTFLRDVTELRALERHLTSVREEEQSRIARELHDELGQALTVLKMDVSWLRRRAQQHGEDVSHKLAAMNSLLGSIIESVQRIASELRPALLDNLGLVAAIEWLAHNFEERTDIDCLFVHSIDAPAELDKHLETALFRIAQEALTNVARHAGAQSASISLQVTQTEICLEIKDDGIGITPAQINHPRSFGLLGMRERLHPWNGHLAISGTPDEGTTVHILIQRRQRPEQPEQPGRPERQGGHHDSSIDRG